MFKTIIAFIKAHTIATTITTTIVVSTVVATPIIVNKIQENNQEAEIAQNQENIIDNSVIDNTVENEVTEENIIIDENTTEEKQTTDETPKEIDNKQEQNQETSKPTTSNPTTNNNKTEDKGTWIRYNFDEYSYIMINKTTQKVKPYGCYGNVVDDEEYSYSELKSIIIPEERKQYQEWLERNIADDDSVWQEFGIPKENKIKEYEKELEKIDRFKNYVINSGEQYDMNKVVSFEGSGNYVFHPDWIETYKEQVKGLIESEQEKLEYYIEIRHEQENYLRKKMEIFESNVNTILSNL